MAKTKVNANAVENLEALAQLFTPEQINALAALVNATIATPAPIEASTTEAEAPAPVDVDELKARRDKANAAIIATIPKANRGVVQSMLNRAHKAGYPYARLAVNKEHQKDGLHIYAGEKGRGREDAFKGCMTKQGKTHAEARAKAAHDGKPAPAPVARVFYWSPVGGGNLYARGIFGDIES